MTEGPDPTSGSPWSAPRPDDGGSGQPSSTGQPAQGQPPAQRGPRSGGYGQPAADQPDYGQSGSGQSGGSYGQSGSGQSGGSYGQSGNDSGGYGQNAGGYGQSTGGYGQPAGGYGQGQTGYGSGYSAAPAGNPYGGYANPYGNPYGNPYDTGAQNNGMGTASMVLGIVSIPAVFFCVGIITAILAIIFGFVGRGRVGRGEASNGGQALTGIICGGVAIVLFILAIVLVVATSSNDNSYDLMRAVLGRAT